MISLFKRIARHVRLYFWVKRYAKPFRTTADCNQFEITARDEQEKYFLPVTDKVGWDQVAYKELKSILGYRPEVGVFEWWEDQEAFPRYVLNGTPGFRIEMTDLPFPEKWKVAKGGYFIPAYETEF